MINQIRKVNKWNTAHALVSFVSTPEDVYSFHIFPDCVHLLNYWFSKIEAYWVKL